VRPPQDWRAARLTLILSGIIALAWLLAYGARLDLGALAAYGGFVPARVGAEADPLPIPVILTPLTATLIHGGFLHLVFNLLILLLCGRSVEPILGARGLAILFVVGAYAATAAEWLAMPAATGPAIGASGAISAVLGAYALLLGRNKVKVRDPRLALFLHALWLGAAWVGLQLLVAVTVPLLDARVGIAAHIGGFLVGLLLAKPLLLLRWRGA
jgi:membrane associated rhomboid family serine protease